MGKLFKIFVPAIILLFLSAAAGQADISGSSFNAEIYWIAGDPGLGDRFTFIFNSDGSFEIPELGDEQGDYLEISLLSPSDEFEVGWVEAIREDIELRVNLRAFTFEFLVKMPDSGLPVWVQTIFGRGELVDFRPVIDEYFPFSFSGYSFLDEITPQFLQAAPAWAFQGEEDKYITIFCANTGFTAQSPSVAFENSGIEINRTEIINDTSLKINIDVQGDAPVGKDDIIIDLGGGHGLIIAQDSFEIREKEKSEIVGIEPDYGFQGETDKNIIIFCSNTRFTAQSSGVAFENSGVRVNSVEVVNDTSLQVNIDINEDAPRGKGDIIVSLGSGEILIAKNGFEIMGQL